jgi:drug/metabolite transporter (DMT)-like permease
MARKNFDAALFFLLAAMWGGSFVAIKFVVAVFPPLFGAALRLGVALAAIGGWFTYERRNLRVDPATRRKMWLAGLFAQGLPFALLFSGERAIAPGLAGIINGTVPLFTFAFGAALGAGERVTPRKTAGLLLGFVGIGAICAPLIAFGGTRAEIVGVAEVVGMSICYAIGSLLTKSLLSGAKADFRANAFHQNCASFAFVAAVSLALEPVPAAAVLRSAGAAWTGVLYLGLFSTALAFLIYFHLIREWGAVRASAVTYVAPVFAVFWDFVFFGRVLTAAEFVGVAAILSGVLLLREPAKA